MPLATQVYSQSRVPARREVRETHEALPSRGCARHPGSYARRSPARMIFPAHLFEWVIHWDSAVICIPIIRTVLALATMALPFSRPQRRGAFVEAPQRWDHIDSYRSHLCTSAPFGVSTRKQRRSADWCARSRTYGLGISPAGLITQRIWSLVGRMSARNKSNPKEERNLRQIALPCRWNIFSEFSCRFFQYTHRFLRRRAMR